MKSTILTQAPLATIKDQLIWLALDYDRPKNAAFFDKYPIDAFPTFIMIDGATGTVNDR